MKANIKDAQCYCVCCNHRGCRHADCNAVAELADIGSSPPDSITALALLTQKVKDLEGKMDTLVSESINEHMNLRGRVKDLQDRQFKVEQWIGNLDAKLSKRVKDLEDKVKNNKDSFTTVWRDQEQRLQDLERNWGSFFTKIKDLEDWKKKCSDLEDSTLLAESVCIDKKVWEHITYLIEMMDFNWNPEIKPHNNDVKKWLTEALNLIKKADPND